MQVLQEHWEEGGDNYLAVVSGNQSYVWFTGNGKNLLENMGVKQFGTESFTSARLRNGSAGDGKIRVMVDVKFNLQDGVEMCAEGGAFSNEGLVREFIREALLTEAFTKTDEKAIEVMARKQIDKKWKEHEKKIDKMFDERDKTLFRNDAFYKVIARIYQELQRAYAEDQFKYATRYTRKDIPLARFRPS